MHSIQTFHKMLEKARDKDRELTRMEHEYGFAAPSECDPLPLLGTAQSALECAIISEDWQIACEAFVFLEQAIRVMAGGDREAGQISP